jgi:hypothetical protein
LLQMNNASAQSSLHNACFDVTLTTLLHCNLISML